MSGAPRYPTMPDRTKLMLSPETNAKAQPAMNAVQEALAVRYHDPEISGPALEKATNALKEHAKSVKEDFKSGIASGIVRNRATVKQGMKTSMGGKTRRNTSTGGDIVTALLTIRNQVKLYHWQTGSFARHTATDNLTAALDTNIDAFVESYMGRYGRPKVSGSIKLHNFSESAARDFVSKQTAYLSTVLPRKIKKTDTDLLNLRDTILGDLTKVLYLFTLQ